MKPQSLFSILLPCLLIATQAVEAQQAAKIRRIGLLLPATGSTSLGYIETFRQRLQELGYIEGKNILIESRNAEGKLERLPDLAAELVRLKVDVLVTNGQPGAFAAKKASATIPIIFAFAGDPIGSGIVSSLARPGGNITGLSLMSLDLSGKRLELLKEAFPRALRVGFLWQPGATRGNLPLTELEAVAKALKFKLLSLEVRSLDDFAGAFARGKTERIQALITNPNPLIAAQLRRVLDFAAKNRLPAIYPNPDFVDAGGLMSYGPNVHNLWRRAADFVDKIFTGTKPEEIPVEQPMKFEFVINLKNAKQIGMTIPPNVLVRADRVIR
jgi:putative ABC transport system substrate-binding protein